MIFHPQFEGSVSIASAALPFIEAFTTRVAAGLLTGTSHPRSRYLVHDTGPERLAVSAADWWTALNVGLNEIELRLPGDGFVHYRVRYWRWALFGLGLGGVLSIVGLALLLGTDVRAYIERHSNSMVPGLSVEQNLWIAWVMVLFWGFAWPWLLIAMHKRPVRALLERIIADVDAGAAGSVPGHGRARRR
jgi:hypothetical protein